MKNPNKYPRVLIIYHSCINKTDQHGVSIREWFADWSSQNLAQIYSGGEVGEERFCGYNLKLGQKERRLGKFFFKLKGSSIGQSSYTISLDEHFKKLNKFSFWLLFKNKISEWLINTGLWEVIFKPILSKELIKFVEDFNPQIIYCQGYNLTFSWLPVMLHNRFNIPICFQTGDDWPAYLYKNSPLSFAIQPLVNKAVKSLLSKSSVRLANGKLMVQVYLQRYGLPFEALMMCDNLYRFHNATSFRVVDSKTKSIVYAGNLGQGRWISIIELCRAAKSIQINGYKIMITALATTVPPEAVNKLREIDNLQILPGPTHEELPSYLKGADVLFLPETFDAIKANEIRLSISTKAHFYMMSEKPILVYAPPITGIVDYAKDELWACIVEVQNINKLTFALNNLLTNNEYREELVRKGIEVVSKNHVEDKIRERFLYILNKFQTN